MHPVGFEPTISAGERPQTYAFDNAATGTGIEGILDLETNTKVVLKEQDVKVSTGLNWLRIGSNDERL